MLSKVSLLSNSRELYGKVLSPSVSKKGIKLPSSFLQSPLLRPNQLKQNNSFLKSQSKFTSLFPQHTSLLKKNGYATERNLNLLAEKDELTNARIFRISIPLTNETCLFALKGDQTVRDFLNDLKSEDPSIQQLSLYNAEGARISASSRLEDVLKAPFQLAVNGTRFNVTLNSSQIGSNSSVSSNNPQGAVSSSTSNPDDVQQIEKDLLPLLQQKRALDNKAYRYADFVLWGGLGAFLAQWCFLARLTWWEFNWDIMEPVTYFITSGTALLGYVYFVFAKQEYTFANLRDGMATKRMFKNYIRSGFDIDKYYDLEYRLQEKDPEGLDRLEAILDHTESNQMERISQSEADKRAHHREQVIEAKAN